MADKRLRAVLLVGLLILAIISINYIPRRALSASGSIDFHSYWYAGIFLRQGQDPYQAYLLDLNPVLPIKFLDLPDLEFSSIAQPGLATVPANTAPIVWLLSIFSWFSWPAARLLWLICNLILIPVVFRLALAYTPKPQLKRWDYLILFTAFISLFGIRNTTGNGQTSLLIFCFMLLALLLVDRKPILAGALLGFALSKYSIALPVLLLFALRKKTSPILTAFGVQITAAIILHWHTGSSLLEIFDAYFQIAQEHTTQPGIHLTAAFSPPVGEFLLAAFTLMLCSIPVIVFFRRFRAGMSGVSRILLVDQQQFHIYHLLLCYLLISVYHRNYDTFIIFPLLVWLYGKIKSSSAAKEANWRRTQALLLGFCFVVLVIPASGMQNIFDRLEISVINGSSLEAILASLCLSLLFLYCFVNIFPVPTAWKNSRSE